MNRIQALTDRTRPVWSVMIPAYNPDRRFLEETLRCVLSQDPGSDKMQIEVVDDCSPNGSLDEWVRNVAGERITVFRGEKNLGLSGIWNRCIERARGQYIHILHQDDLVFPGFYEALENGFRQHPEAGASFCRHSFCDEKSHWRNLSQLEMSEPGLFPDMVETLASRNCVQCASMVVKRSTYEKLGGFNPELKHALDWEMWIRIASSFPIFYEPRILASWRQHQNATTSKQILDGENTRDIAQAIGVWSQYLPPEQRRRLSSLSRRIHALGALNLSEYLYREGNRKSYRNQMASAILCDPSLGIRFRATLLRLKFMVRPLVRWILRR